MLLILTRDHTVIQQFIKPQQKLLYVAACIHTIWNRLYRSYGLWLLKCLGLTFQFQWFDTDTVIESQTE